MSPASVSFHPEAIEEALSAASWYRERSPITAKRFLTELNQVLDTIVEAPHRWPISPRGVRKLKLPCFPYFLIYRVKDTGVLILAVAHGHRCPGYWKDRL